MKHLLIVIIGIALLTGCKENISKFIFDSSKMSTLTKYYYDYDSNRLTSSKEITYIFMFGNVVDTMIETSNYEYNNKNFLIRKTSKFGSGDILDICLYDYDSNDSLIREIVISSEGDTSRLTEYGNFKDGRKEILKRILFRRLGPNQDFASWMKNKQYDTIYFRREFTYDNNLCQSERQYDIRNKIEKRIDYKYENSRLIKEIQFDYFNSLELINRIRFFDYSKSESNPDYYSLNKRNDTLEKRINIFDNGILLITKDILDYGNATDNSFFKNNKKIGWVFTDRKMNRKEVVSYEYYENGDLKEQKSYTEKINAH
jgi:hypothetical protein